MCLLYMYIKFIVQLQLNMLLYFLQQFIYYKYLQSIDNCTNYEPYHIHSPK